MSKIEQNSQDILELNKLIYNTLMTQNDYIDSVNDNVSKLGTSFLRSNKDIQDSHDKIEKHNQTLEMLLAKQNDVKSRLFENVDAQRKIAQQLNENKDYFVEIINSINKSTFDNTEANTNLIKAIKESNNSYTEAIITLSTELSTASKNIEDATNIEKIKQLGSKLDTLISKVDSLVSSTQKQNDDRQKRIEMLGSKLDNVNNILDETNKFEQLLVEKIGEVNSKMTVTKIKVEALYESQIVEDKIEEQESTENLNKDETKVGESNE